MMEGCRQDPARAVMPCCALGAYSKMGSSCYPRALKNKEKVPLRNVFGHAQNYICCVHHISTHTSLMTVVISNFFPIVYLCTALTSINHLSFY